MKETPALLCLLMMSDCATQKTVPPEPDPVVPIEDTDKPISRSEIKEIESLAPAETTPNQSGSQMRLVRDCAVYPKPSDKSKLLKIRRKGESIWVWSFNKKWDSIYLGKRLGYLKKNCFTK